MKKKLYCILMLIVLLLNSSVMLIISEAVDAINDNKENTTDEKVKTLAEINLTKYENFDTTTEENDSGSKGVLVQFNLKTGIQYEEGEEYVPIKKTSTNIDLPWIGDYKPSRVEVITKSTQATNGKKEARYDYHSSTGILQIIAEIDDYTENNQDARDEYEVICIYRKECYTDNEERNFKIRANVETTLDNEDETKVTTKTEQEYTLTNSMGTIISTEHQTGDIYDGYVVANSLNSENQYETKYNEKLKLMISNKDLSTKIELKENSEASLYEESIIDKNQVLDMLGEEGSIEVLGNNETILSTINKDTETDENGKIKIEYAERTNNIYIRLNNINKEGIIEIDNARVIIPSAIITDDTVSTQINIKGLADDNTVKYERNGQSNLKLKQSESNIETKIDTDTWVNNTTNEVVMTAVLKTDNEKYSLFKNPSIDIEMPSEVSNVKIGDSGVIYDNKTFNITQAKVKTNQDGNKYVHLQLEGAQTTYEQSSVVDGATIRVPLNITLKKSIDNKVGNINVTYFNEMDNSTKTNEMEITLLNKIVNIVPDSYSKINSNIATYNSNGVTATAEQDGIRTEIIEEVGNVLVENEGTIYEQQIIEQNINVTNTSSTTKKMTLTLNVPDEMIYVKKEDDNGFIYHEDHNYYESSTKYEYVEQQDKKVKIDFNLKAGETKTDLIELKVKDLQDNEQEKETNINYVAQVDNGNSAEINIKNKVKQAQIDVKTRLVLGSVRNEWDYTITITNLTDKELKNVNVVLETSDIYKFEYVNVNQESNIENIEGNIWRYTIDSIEPGKEVYYFSVGTVDNTDDSTGLEYELKGVTTVYGDDIDTYVSNEARMTGYKEAVEVTMTADKDKLKMDDEITYTVNIKNIGKTWKGFDTYTQINVQDVIPRDLQPISVEYNKFTINTEMYKNEGGLEFEVQSYTESQETRDISTLDIPEGYDEEDAPNIDLPLSIPEGKTVTLKIKAKAKMLGENTKVTNTITATGKWIKNKEASADITILKYDYDENPDNPVNPDNPDTPVNPDDPNTPSSKKVSISGIAWIDENEDGKRTTGEKTCNNVTVMLYDYKNNKFVKDNDQIKNVQTNDKGEYRFDNIDKGQYIVIFLYDTSKYSVTEYKKNGILESKNSDAITKTVGINGETVTAGLTDTLNVEANLENIDIGLIEKKSFDLEIQKYISKITVQTKDGKTKTYDYNNKQFAKVEIHSKKINGATAIIEYKMLITNKGELDGKAVQIIDKLPDGLNFKSELNSDWYEKDGSLYTNILSGQNIKVGESKEVTLVLTKNINNGNVGTITNTASIGISSNDKATEDVKVQNNTSNAQVLIGVSTGLAGKISITIIAIILLILLAIVVLKNKKILKATLFASALVICLFGNMPNVFGAYYIQGVNMHYSSSQTARGSDGSTFTCHTHGARFCDRWHLAEVKSKSEPIIREGTWPAEPGALTLTNNTGQNVKFIEKDSNYNNAGPFKVTTNNNSATIDSVVVTYKDSNQNTRTGTFETSNLGFGRDFYIQVPNSVVQIIKVTVNVSYSVTQTRTNIVKREWIYKTTGLKTYNGRSRDPYIDPPYNDPVYTGAHGNSRNTYDPHCYGMNNVQDMLWVSGEETREESRTITRQASVDINGPWTSTGELEIKKVDSKNNNTVLKDTEFKLEKGTNANASLLIQKNGVKVDRIVVDTEIAIGEDGKSATINGESGYTVQFNTSLNNATTLVTNKNGVVLIKKLLCGQYTFVENKNINYGYTTMVTKSVTMGSEKTTFIVGNDKNVGEINIKKIDDRNINKILPGVQFVLRASNKQGYIRIKPSIGESGNVTMLGQWADTIIGTAKIKDTDDVNNNPVIGYTESIEDATKFITDEKGELSIKNLLIKEGNTAIKYKFEEIYNPNYGYLADTENYKNHGVTYEGNAVDKDGWITVDSNTSIKIKNHQEYIRIEGTVWEEILNSKNNMANNIYNSDTDAQVEGINVYLYKNGKIVTSTTTNSNGWYEFGTIKKGDDINDNYDVNDYLEEENGNLKIDDLDKYYVEFEYDGLKFTSVEADINYQSDDYSISAKSSEVQKQRNDRKDRQDINEDFTEITNNTSRNSKGEETYKLEYDFNNHVSTYKDYWRYEYNDEKNKLKVTPAKEYTIIASTEESNFNLKDAWQDRCAKSGSESLTAINLGIKRREQPDLAISSDIATVNIGVGNYENTYQYAKRMDYQEQNENDPEYDAAKDGFGIDVKFGNSLGSYSDRGLNKYTRRVYESDLAYYSVSGDDDFMKIYITYRMRIKNQSSKLTATVNELVNYYDSRYTIEDSWVTEANDSKKTIIDKNDWKSTSKYGESYNDKENGYVAAYCQAMSNLTIAPNEYIDVYINFRLKPEAVKALLQKQTTLNNVTEITSFSTMSEENNKLVAYAGIDKDSNPGSVKEIKLSDKGNIDARKEEASQKPSYVLEKKELDMTEYEDDTDYAPSFIIGVQEDEPERGLSGVVFEDANSKFNDDETHMNEERLGDGILTTESGTGRRIDTNRVEGATVELLDKNLNPVKLYQLGVDSNGKAKINEIIATTTTDEKGEYKLLGVLPGEYLIRYTYNENCYITNQSGQRISGPLNVRDYKSTIITSDIIKNALNLGSASERKEDNNWILKYDAVPQNGNYTTDARSKSKNAEGLIRYSSAVDDINKRNEVDDVYYGTYGQNLSMTADTAYFDVGVEFSQVDGFDIKSSFTDYKDEYNLDNNRIVTLDENGRIIIMPTFYAVNPYQDFGMTERARQDYEVNKRISNIKITLENGQLLISGNPYKPVPDLVTNLKETWNNLENGSEQTLPYTKALPGQVNIEIDNEILQGAQLDIEYIISIKNESEIDYKYMENQNYYYYGDSANIEKTETAIKKVVDYMDDSLIYNEAKNTDYNWQKTTADDLKNWKDSDSSDITKKLISDDVYNGIKNGYTIAVTDYFYDNVVPIGGIRSTKICGSKLLSTQESGVTVTNHAEIVETIGIRSLWGSTPGNYNPSDKGGSPNEQDDDKTKLTITPPTGTKDNTVFIISTTIMSLVVLARGVYLIKKNVLG